jgi:hypothetical protein
MGDISTPKKSLEKSVRFTEDSADAASVNAVPQAEEVEAESSVFPYQETSQNKSWASTLPMKQGLYDPALEKDACGVGFSA